MVSRLNGEASAWFNAAPDNVRLEYDNLNSIMCELLHYRVRTKVGTGQFDSIVDHSASAIYRKLCVKKF